VCPFSVFSSLGACGQSRQSKAFKKALAFPKIPVHLSSISADASNTLHAHLQTGTLDSSFVSRDAEVYIAVALNRAESQVSAGENSGHGLTHVSVASVLQGLVL